MNIFYLNLLYDGSIFIETGLYTMNQKFRKLFCPDWCPKKMTECNFECYEWEEAGIENRHADNNKMPFNKQNRK